MKKNSGITLIALAITMVIMLIIAAISVTALSGDNSLIHNVGEAKDGADAKNEKDIIDQAVYQAINNNRFGELDATELQSVLNNLAGSEISSIENIEDGIQINFKSGRSYVVGTDGGSIVEPTDRTGIEIGDYLDYEPDVPASTVYSKSTLGTYSGSTQNNADIVQDSLDWQVLRKYADGSMDLIGSVTSQNIHFNGIRGYNNGVYLMNDICKTLYSRNGIQARSVNIKDLEYWLNKSEEGTAARSSYITSTNVAYGETKTYTENNNYPSFYKTQKDESDIGNLTTSNTSETDGNLTVKETYYTVNINETNYGEGAKVLTSGTYYWLGSRCECNTDYVHFSFFTVQRSVGKYDVFWSTGEARHNYCTLRPVVHLKSSIQITPRAGTASEKHHIESY